MFLLLWSVAALLVCEEHLDITVGFSLKIDSEMGLLCRFEQPTVIEAITAVLKAKPAVMWCSSFFEKCSSYVLSRITFHFLLNSSDWLNS